MKRYKPDKTITDEHKKEKIKSRDESVDKILEKKARILEYCGFEGDIEDSILKSFK